YPFDTVTVAYAINCWHNIATAFIANIPAQVPPHDENAAHDLECATIVRSDILLTPLLWHTLLTAGIILPQLLLPIFPRRFHPMMRMRHMIWNAPLSSDLISF